MIIKFTHKFIGTVELVVAFEVFICLLIALFKL